MGSLAGNRRQAREAALAYLYQRELYPESLTRSIESFERHFSVAEAFKPYFEKLCKGAVEHSSEIDQEIVAVAEHWKLSRMAKVDLSILRLASFELIYCLETSHQIIIDEAIELAKDYGAQDSASFVNGLLDRIAKKVRSSSPLILTGTTP